MVHISLTRNTQHTPTIKDSGYVSLTEVLRNAYGFQMWLCGSQSPRSFRARRVCGVAVRSPFGADTTRSRPTSCYTALECSGRCDRSARIPRGKGDEAHRLHRWPDCDEGSRDACTSWDFARYISHRA